MRERQSRFNGRFPTYEGNGAARHIELRDGRDRFGNMYFASPELTYRDQLDRETRAGILISPAGETFLREHPGLLKQLDRALQTPRSDQSNPVHIDTHTALIPIGRGGQSQAYRLDINETSFVIRTQNPRSRLAQPYINEMLQTQALAADCAEEFQVLGVGFPTMLFASGTVSCSEYIPEEFPQHMWSQSLFYAIATTAEEYLDDRKKTDDLWKGIQMDKAGGPKLARNFRRRKNGDVVWIDPFIATEKRLAKSPQIELPPEFLNDLVRLPPMEKQTAYLQAKHDIDIIHTAMRSNADDAALWEHGVLDAVTALGIMRQDGEDLAVTIQRAEYEILLRHHVRWVNV